MINQGRMTKFGLTKIDSAKKNGFWNKPDRLDISFDLPPEFEQALEKNENAKGNFEKLTTGYQKHYIGWITIAKKQETIDKRIKESILLLEQGKKLGLK